MSACVEMQLYHKSLTAFLENLICDQLKVVHHHNIPPGQFIYGDFKFKKYNKHILIDEFDPEMQFSDVFWLLDGNRFLYVEYTYKDKRFTVTIHNVEEIYTIYYDNIMATITDYIRKLEQTMPITNASAHIDLEQCDAIELMIQAYQANRSANFFIDYFPDRLITIKEVIKIIKQANKFVVLLTSVQNAAIWIKYLNMCSLPTENRVNKIEQKFNFSVLILTNRTYHSYKCRMTDKPHLRELVSWTIVDFSHEIVETFKHRILFSNYALIMDNFTQTETHISFINKLGRYYVDYGIVAFHTNTSNRCVSIAMLLLNEVHLRNVVLYCTAKEIEHAMFIFNSFGIETVKYTNHANDKENVYTTNRIMLVNYDTCPTPYIPNAHCCAFLSISNHVNTIQAIIGTLKVFPGKKKAYIIVPFTNIDVFGNFLLRLNAFDQRVVKEIEEGVHSQRITVCCDYPNIDSDEIHQQISQYFRVPWINHFEQLHKYIIRFNCMPTASQSWWINTQLKRYKLGAVTEPEMIYLTSLNGWSFYDPYDYWYYHYNDLLLFIEKNKRLPTGIEMPWVNQQRDLYLDKKLSTDKIQLLENVIKWIWYATPDAEWEMNFIYAITSYISPQDSIENEKQCWIALQKLHRQHELLSIVQICLLTDAGLL